jgi:hypothetical protein
MLKSKKSVKVFLKDSGIREYSHSDALILAYHKTHSSRKDFMKYYGFPPEAVDYILWEYPNFKEIERKGKIIRDKEEKAPYEILI